MIERSVESVVTDSPSRKVALASKLIKALERDGDWVEMYRVSGELVVSGPIDGEEEHDESLALVKAVSRSVPCYCDV